MTGIKALISFAAWLLLVWGAAGTAACSPPVAAEAVGSAGTQPEKAATAGSPVLAMALLPGGPAGMVRLRLEVAEGRLPGPLTGCLEVAPAAGGLSAVFLELPPGEAWVVELARPAPGPCTVRLMVWTSGERPLVLTAAPLLLESPAAPGSDASAPSRWSRWRGVWEKVKLPSALGRLKALPWWPWGAAALGGLAVLAGALLLLQRRRRRPASGPEVLLSGVGVPEEMRLLADARLAALEKEKAALAQALEEARQERDRLRGEKAALEQEMDRQTEASREKSRIIQELEQKLEQAQDEAKAMQQEYMALYARSGAEKETLRKN